MNLEKVLSTIVSDEFELEINKDLTKYSTMKLKSFGDLITIKSESALKTILPLLKKQNIEYRVLGWGANLLLPEKSSVPYIQLDFSFDKKILENAQDEYILPASISLAVLTSHAAKFGLKGWEVFTGIPASLGGAIYMNAGTNLGEIGSVIKEVKIITSSGEEKLIKIDKNSFSYRKNHFVEKGDVIYQAKLVHFGQDSAITMKIREYLELRNRTQPLKEPTCGCVFKNNVDDVRGVTCRAGHFIDIIGLKGFTHGNLRVSPKHANFIENFGESSFDQANFMIETIRKELKLQFGVEFEVEVER